MANETYRLKIGDERTGNNNVYGNFTVQFPQNYTNNTAFIGQHKLNTPDLSGGSDSHAWDWQNAGQLMSCFEINWGDAIEGWRNDNGTVNQDRVNEWKTGNYDFPNCIRTSADLLRYIFMLRWKLENLNLAPATYSLSINPASKLTIQYHGTGTATATATQTGTNATVSTYTWSLSNNKNSSNQDKFSINAGQGTNIVTVKHDETLTSTWTLPTPTTEITQSMSSTTGTAKVKCTPNTPTENAPTASSATLTCQASWSNGHNESKSITVQSNGYDHAAQPTVTGYQWRITSGESYASLSNATSQTCTLTGIAAGTVKVKCKVTWSSGNKETSEVSITVPSPQVTYYWYVGATQPTALPTSDSGLATGTNPGWRKIGNSKPSAGTVIFDGTAQDEIVCGTTKVTQYFAINSNVTIGSYDSFGVDQTSSFLTGPTVSNGMNIYTSVAKSKTFGQIIKVK